MSKECVHFFGPLCMCIYHILCHFINSYSERPASIQTKEAGNGLYPAGPLMMMMIQFYFHIQFHVTLLHASLSILNSKCPLKTFVEIHFSSVIFYSLLFPSFYYLILYSPLSLLFFLLHFFTSSSRPF